MSSTSTTAVGTFVKFDGEWLIRTSQVNPGDTVRVTKRDGSVSVVTVSANTALDNEDGTWLVSFVSQARPAAARTQGTARGIRPNSYSRGRKCCTDCRAILQAWEIRDYGTRCHDCN